jgi:hypothetical protein
MGQVYTKNSVETGSLNKVTGQELGLPMTTCQVGLPIPKSNGLADAMLCVHFDELPCE